MKKSIAILLALGIGAITWFELSRPSRPAPPSHAVVPMETRPLSEGVYAVLNQVGNVLVSEGKDGLLLVDGTDEVQAPALSEQVKKGGKAPLRYVINTHWHADHAGGNAVLGREAVIMAHANVKKRMEKGSLETRYSSLARRFNAKLAAWNMKAHRSECVTSRLPPFPPQALPGKTYNSELSIVFNGETIRILHLPNAHTDGDSVVVFERSKVAHLGDDLWPGALPYFDRGAGGTAKGLLAGLDRLVRELPDDVTIVPGHGPITNKAYLRQTAEMLRDSIDLVGNAIKEGKTLKQMQSEKLLGKYDPHRKDDYIRIDTFTALIYDELTGSQNCD